LIRSTQEKGLDLCCIHRVLLAVSLTAMFNE
jgi:hypothetical protein